MGTLVIRAGLSSRMYILFNLIVATILPHSAAAIVEIPKPGVIVMNHLPNPVYFDGQGTPDAETAIAAYGREIREIVGIGASAVALDGFNTLRDKTRLAYWKEAIARHNAERGGKFCFFLLADFDVEVWPGADIRSVYDSLVDSPYYCSIRNKPVLGTYRGEQASAEWYLANVLDPLRADGREPFFLIFFRGTKTEAIIGDYLDVWSARAYDAGFYRFSGNTPQATLNGARPEKPKYDAAGYLYVPGFGTSYWAACSSKPNAGVYLEHDGLEGLDLLWQNMIPGGALRGDYVMLTVWNDVGEDNFFSRRSKTSFFFRNPDIHSWTHRGFHEFSKYYVSIFRGRQPPQADWVYWAYRQHPKDLPPPPGDECVEYGNTLQVTGAIEDVIYATTVLKAPAELQITLGGATSSFLQPAGIAHVRVPWGTGRGRPRFVLSRAGVQLMAKSGSLAITDSPVGRDGEGTRNYNHYADFMSRR